MSRFAALLLLAVVSLVVALPQACFAATPVHQPKGLRVVGYVPEYRHGGVQWESVLGKLTDVVLFSIEATEDGHLSGLDRLPDAALMEDIRSTARRSGTNILVCIGGSGRNEGLTVALRSKEATETLVRALVELVDSMELQGIDVNYEHPNAGMEEHGALASFLKALKGAIGERLVTLPIHPGQEQLVLRQGILDTVDFVSEMAYDNFCHFPPDSPPCRHATMPFAEMIVRHATSIGLNSRKLMLGLPFYGRHMISGQAKVSHAHTHTHASTHTYTLASELFCQLPPRLSPEHPPPLHD